MRRRSSSSARSPERSRSRLSPPPSPNAFRASLLIPLPTPSLVESVASGAHHSSLRMPPEHGKHIRHSSVGRHLSHTIIKHDHERILDDLEELYCCRPTAEIFERTWNKDAVLEDPLSTCKGFREYVAQWYAMAKVFSKSETISRRVLSSTKVPNRLVFAQKQTYTFRLFARKWTVDSIIVIDLDDDDKIIRMLDQWNGRDPPTKYGMRSLRRLNGRVIPLFVAVPKQNRRANDGRTD